MPTFVSVSGEWSPGKERVALKNLSGKVKTINGQTVEPGDDYIYEGPDRAALYLLYEQGSEKLGQHFRTNMDMVNLVRQLGFKTMDEYLDFVGVKETDEEKKSKEALVSKVTRHELPKRIKEIEVMSGGTEQGTGTIIRKGGWDRPPDL